MPKKKEEKTESEKSKRSSSKRTLPSDNGLASDSDIDPGVLSKQNNSKKPKEKSKQKPKDTVAISLDSDIKETKVDPETVLVLQTEIIDSIKDVEGDCGQPTLTSTPKKSKGKKKSLPLNLEEKHSDAIVTEG